MILQLGDRFKLLIFADQFVEGENGCLWRTTILHFKELDRNGIMVHAGYFQLSLA